MSARIRIWACTLGAAALALACNFAGILPPPPGPPCFTNSDCARGAICFQDGCGDPGRNLTIQVTHQGVAQELPIEELRPTYDQELGRPPTFSGLITQATSSGPIPFTGKVTFKGSGTALLLPGIGRRIESPVLPSSGQFSVGVSTGLYGGSQFGPLSVIADIGLPPLLVNDSWRVDPGSQVHLDVTFPPTSALTRITGTLLLSLAAGTISTPMQVQVLNADFHRPISQMALVDQFGTFSMLAPPLPPGSTVEILAAPKPGAVAVDTIVPSRIFRRITITSPLTTPLLQMGEFGSTVTVSGTALDAGGQPVPGAKVYTERQLQEGNNFQSAATTSAADGSFAVRSLPALGVDDAVSLWIVPPAGSTAGTFQVVMNVPLQGGSVGPLRCPRRVPVVGQVLRPSGEAPASGVTVRADPVGGVDGRKPPDFSVETTTDMDGHFRLLVDPAEYRLDFLPDILPRVSRRVTVQPQPGPEDPVAVEVAPFTLFNGRTLSGTITGFATTSATSPAALGGASVELFRVASEGDKQISYSLAKVATDSAGKYTMTIPTASPPP